MSDFVAFAGAIGLMWKIVDFAKHVRVRDWNASVTQAVTWGAGVLVIFVLANSDFANGVPVGDQNLGALNDWSLVLVGLTLSSLGSVAYDYKRAFDRSDSAKMPSLLTGEKPPR